MTPVARFDVRDERGQPPAPGTHVQAGVGVRSTTADQAAVPGPLPGTAEALAERSADS